MPPVLDLSHAQVLDPPRHNWLLVILDAGGAPIDIPRGDVKSIEVEDVINMGSGKGQLELARDTNNIGAIAFGYYVLLWVWNSRALSNRANPPAYRPALPYWWGRIVDIDTDRLTTEGLVTVSLDGVGKDLDRAIVTEEINPEVSGNPTLPAADYVTHLLTTYQPANFVAPVVPGSMFNLKPNKFDGAKLGSCLDTVLKQGRDVRGPLFTWVVRPNFAQNDGRLSTPAPKVVVQPDQDPNKISGVLFKHLFVGPQVVDYKISTKYRDIVNVIALYGGRDPVTDNQVYGAFEDAASVALFGPFEEKVSESELLDPGSLAGFAEVWFDQHAYPQAQGSCRLVHPDPTIVGGTWVQFWEVIGTSSANSFIKQVRVAVSKISIQGERINQTLSTVSPTPYLDEAIYRMGWHIGSILGDKKNDGGSHTGRQGVSYVRSGFTVTGTINGPPANINWVVLVGPGEVVFNNALYTSDGLVPPVSGTRMQGVLDGHYVVYVLPGTLPPGSVLFSIDRISETKIIPPETATSLNLFSFTVIKGVVYV